MSDSALSVLDRSYLYRTLAREAGDTALYLVDRWNRAREGENWNAYSLPFIPARLGVSTLNVLAAFKASRLPPGIASAAHEVRSSVRDRVMSLLDDAEERIEGLEVPEQAPEQAEDVAAHSPDAGERDRSRTAPRL